MRIHAANRPFSAAKPLEIPGECSGGVGDIVVRCPGRTGILIKTRKTMETAFSPRREHRGFHAYCLMKGTRVFCIAFFFFVIACAQVYAATPLTWDDLAEPGILVPKLGGESHSLQGFVVPLEYDEKHALEEFLLVPYFGACIHVPPPPPNQIVHVVLKEPVPDMNAMDYVTVTGTFSFDAGEGSYKSSGATLRKEEESDWSVAFRAILLTLACGGSLAIGWLIPPGGQTRSGSIAAWSMRLAAGMLLGLGLTALFLRFRTDTVLVFFAGMAALVLLERLTRMKTRGATAIATGLALHNFPECFLVCSFSFADIAVGTTLALAMLAHNLPIGLSLGFGLGDLSKRKVRACAALAGLLPPVLAVATYFCVRSFVTPYGIRLAVAGAGGVLTGLALFDIFPHCVRHGSLHHALWGMLAGLCFLFFLLFFLLNFNLLLVLR